MKIKKTQQILIAAIIAIVMSSACASKKISFISLPKSYQNFIGTLASKQIKQKYKVSENEKLLESIKKVFNKIHKARNNKENVHHNGIIIFDDKNAPFAIELPGKNIFISKRLILFCKSYSELAFALSYLYEKNRKEESILSLISEYGYSEIVNAFVSDNEDLKEKIISKAIEISSFGYSKKQIEINIKDALIRTLSIGSNPASAYPFLERLKNDGESYHRFLGGKLEGNISEDIRKLAEMYKRQNADKLKEMKENNDTFENIKKRALKINLEDELDI